MTTTWKIFNTESQIADGVITKVTYGCTVQLDNFIDRVVGTLELVGDTASTGFIEYPALTEETVLGWVKSKLGATYVTATEETLQANVTGAKAARELETVKNGLPWQNL